MHDRQVRRSNLNRRGEWCENKGSTCRNKVAPDFSTRARAAVIISFFNMGACNFYMQVLHAGVRLRAGRVSIATR